MTVVKAEDATSGLQVDAYSFDGGVNWQNKDYRKYTENTNNIQIQVKDIAGNVYTYKTVSVENIDKTVPTLSVAEPSGTAGQNNWFTNDVTIGVTAEDANLSAWYYSLEGGKEGSWTKAAADATSFTITADGDYTNLICVKAVDAAGNETVSALKSAKLDKTNPTGKVQLGNSSWENFLNKITFGLFFKDDQTLKITAADAASGVAKIQYLESATAKTQAELEALTEADWTMYDADVKISAVDKKQTVYYVRIMDLAGNHILLSSDGTEFDTTVPVVTGITNGDTYYTTQEVDVTESNLDTLTVNGIKVTAPATLAPVTEETTYTVIATDQAGNETTIVVTMKPLSVVTKASDDTTKETVTSASKTALEAEKTLIEQLLAEPNVTNMTAAEKAALEKAQQATKDFLKVIDDTAKAAKAANDKIATYDVKTVKSTDKETINTNLTSVKTLLATKNLTDAECKTLEARVWITSLLLWPVATNSSTAFCCCSRVYMQNIILKKSRILFAPPSLIVFRP